MEKPDKKEIFCSFCKKHQKDTGPIITTHSGATICADCLARFKEKMNTTNQRIVKI